MKALKSYILAAAVAFGAVAPASAQQTKMLTADKHNEYGLVYTLPVTALEFTVTARHTSYTAGPYWQYAKKFIGTDKAVAEDYDTWEILSVDGVSYGVPDRDKEYLMQLKPGALTSICVADDGMLLAINKEVDAPAQPKTRAVADIGIKEQVNPREYLQYVNEDFLASQSTAKQAQMLSESLMEIRDAKVSLTRGTAETMPTDGRQLELMLNSLSHQEAAMTAAFLGTSSSETVTRKFTFTPSDDCREVFFRMSGFAGFVDADDLSGDPVYITVKVISEGELPVDAKGEVKKLPKDAVIYNIPGAAKVSLSFKGQTLWSEDVDCAQLGVQFGLAPQLFSDKKERSFAIFDPATGALQKIATVTSEE